VSDTVARLLADKMKDSFGQQVIDDTRPGAGGVIGTQLNHVPFKTSADLYSLAFSGQILMMSEALPSALPHIKSGKLRALAVSAPRRSALLPELPIIDSHHHHWDDGRGRYLVSDFATDLGSDHNIIATVAVEARCMFHAA
jgi:tripartite-type tricarboxylate transporter receptor subunit TctC